MTHPLILARRSCLVLIACLLAGCDGRSAGSAAGDLRQWQGTWKMTATTYDGAPQIADMAWVVKGDRYFIRMNGELHSDPYTITLDADKKQIFVFHHDTPRGTSGGSWKGIYRLDGDTLTVCYDLTGQRYPTAFDASPRSERVLYEFRRE